jgi:predicted acyl esterase
MPADLEVTGELTVTLHASTSAVDADWTAALHRRMASFITLPLIEN